MNRTIQISLSEDSSQDDLLSLYEWLRQDPDIRRESAVEVSVGAGEPGEQSATLEIISLVASTAFSSINLAMAISSWRANRPKAGEILIESDGLTIRARDASDATTRKIVEALTEPPRAE